MRGEARCACEERRSDAVLARRAPVETRRATMRYPALGAVDAATGAGEGWMGSCWSDRRWPVRAGAAGALVLGVLVPMGRAGSEEGAATSAAADSVDPAPWAGHGGSTSGDALAPPCPLCTDPGVPVRVLSVPEVDSIGRAYADTNVARLARIDALLRAGAFGPPASDAARRDAHLLARLLTLNAYSYMIRFGTDPQVVWQADEATLRTAFENISDPGIVPLARLKRARMGLGHMCAEYDLSEKTRTETVIGGRRFAVRIDEVTIRGHRTRALVMDLPTSLHDVVEVWLTAHVCMDVTHRVVDGPPAPYEAYLIDHMRGLWVHKAGLHRPEAFVFWVAPRDPGWKVPPAHPLVGARIYVPRLELRLPSILPDIGFEDLREVDLPQPILTVAYLQSRLYPDWLEAAALRGFKHWGGVGALPPMLRRRYPDL